MLREYPLIKNLIFLILIISSIINLFNHNSNESYIIVILFFSSFFDKKTQIKILNYKIKNTTRSIIIIVVQYVIELALLFIAFLSLNNLFDNFTFYESVIIKSLIMIFIMFNTIGISILTFKSRLLFISFHNKYRGVINLTKKQNDNLDNFIGKYKK